jgi:hypothetical protein
MKAAVKWKIAALTLVTLPAATWLVVATPMSHAPWLAISMGFVPLFIALGIELRVTWKQASEHPESYVEGSPAGNRLAAALAVVLLSLLLWAVCSVVRQHT